MPDEWERRYGLDPYNAANAANDNDSDGYTNIEVSQWNRSDGVCGLYQAGKQRKYAEITGV